MLHLSEQDLQVLTAVSIDLPTEYSLWGEGELIKETSDIIKYLTIKRARRRVAPTVPDPAREHLPGWEAARSAWFC